VLGDGGEVWNADYEGSAANDKPSYEAASEATSVNITTVLLRSVSSGASLRGRTAMLLDARQTHVGRLSDRAASPRVAKLPVDIPRPRASVAEDGEVVLEWTGEKGRAVVDFEGDYRFGYALLRDGSFRAGAHPGNLDDEELPSDLVQYLRELAIAA
jgi:hypothetical protein